MSRVSVTGSKGVMDEVVEAVHDLRLLHVTEYDGSWEGFEPGDPGEGANEAAEKLVTVRSLESILDVDPDEVETTTQVVTDEALAEQLEEIRVEVNDLDDERDDLRDELRAVEEEIDAMEPFVALGIDLDLLGGYDSLSVRVGEGDAAGVEAALSETVDAYETFAAEGHVAVFAHTDETTLQDALVDATFTAIDVPDGEGDPAEHVTELRRREEQLESELDTVEEQLRDLRHEVGPFLLAAEEELSIRVDKREAPLTFATTENAFVAEGWLPTERVPEFERVLTEAVGDHVDFAELERAEYDEDGHAVDREEVGREQSPGEPAPAAADGGTQADGDAKTDGGTVTAANSDPPVVQDNPGPVKPFEALTEVINRPKYSEFDPTFILFLTFPAFFGFMIGDLGYGLLYIALGAALVTQFDNEVIRSLGGVGMWAGGFTALFGILYGEIFGLHTIADVVWGGSAPIHKGLQPVDLKYAQAWLVVSLALGLLHLFVGYLFGFLKELRHGVVAAVTEKGSWVLMMGGIWAFVFSTLAAGKKPPFIFSAFAEKGAINPVTGAAIEKSAVAFSLGFTGFSETVGLVALAVLAVGFVLLLVGEGAVGGLESLNVLVNVLSYTRIAAVLLAKAGMAFVVNLLVFGVYVTEAEGSGLAEWHFGLGGMPASAGVEFHGHQVTEIMFGGLFHSGIAGILGGILILVIGHLLVLALGVTSAGLQAVRLEYVEFFGKFYDGGGKPYLPFGRERTYTTEE
jgi:V/A-type H+-transporting ATPase subunit I